MKASKVSLSAVNVAKAAGRAALAFVLAFALSVPAPALAVADSGQGLAAARLEAGQAQPEAAQPEAAGEAAEAAGIWDGSVDTAWYTNPKSSAYYEISTAADLAGLAAIANGAGKTPGGADIARDTFAGKVVKLSQDITLNATTADGETDGMNQWTPIAAPTLVTVLDGTEGDMPSMDYENKFAGTFDGQGHLVKNIYISKSEAYGGYQGLFGALGAGATVKNLGIDGGYVTGRVAGGVASVSNVGKDEAAPRIIACYNTATIVGNGSSMRGAGGIFGGQDQYSAAADIYTGAAYIADCINVGSVSAANSNAPRGGIAGTGNIQIHGCINVGDVAVAQWRSGAIAGQLVAEGYQNPSHPTGIGETYKSAVRHSVALDGCTSNGVLYRMLSKVGDNEKSDGIDVADADDVKFRAESVLTDVFAGTDDALRYLGHAFDYPARGTFGGWPTLFWQNSGAEKSLNSLGLAVPAIGSQVFTGAAVEPDITARYNDNGKVVTLVQGADFIADYKNNVAVGKASASITGIGLYTGKYSKSLGFDIVGTDISKAEVEGLWDRWYYGELPSVDEVAANVKVKLGGRELGAGDYSISYNLVAPAGAEQTSTCTATITGKGSMKGEKTVEFKLVRASSGLRAGTDDEGGYYELSSKQDVQFLAHMLNVRAEGYESYDRARYKLTSDIDATCDADDGLNLSCEPIGFGNHWTGSGSVHARGFAGEIDGQGHTLTIRLVDDEINLEPAMEDSVAFIAQTGEGEGVVLKNLTIDGLVDSPSSEATAFVGRANGDVTFENCVNKATVRSSVFTMGSAGFVNVSWGNLKFKDCVNEGAISSVSGWAAGFVKLNYGATSYTFEDCENKGAISSGLNHSGGFIANLDNEGGTVTMTGCVNSGDVTSSENGSIGGFIGSCMPHDKSITVNIDRCSNSGHIDGAATSGSSMGGFIGWMQKATCTIENSYNVGTISAHQGNDSMAYGRPAGFIGYCYSPGSDPYEDGDDDEAASDRDYGFVLRNVYNAGSIEQLAREGGALIGSAYEHTHPRVANAYYASDVTPGLGAAGNCTTVGAAVAKTLAEMKQPVFPYLLGAAFGRDAANENGGLPVLGAGGGSFDDDGTCKLSTTEVGVQRYENGFDLPVKVVSEDGAVELSEGEDYTVSYFAVDSANGGEDAGVAYDGTARAVFEGTGAGFAAWSGVLVLDFKYAKQELSADMLGDIYELDVEASDKPYAPAVTVTDDGVELAAGVDYEVSFAVNGEPDGDLRASATATVTAIGDWHKGSASKAFSIVLGDLSQCTLASGIDDEMAYDPENGPVVYLNKVSVLSRQGVALDAGFMTGRPADFDLDVRGADGSAPESIKDIAAGNIQVVLTGVNAWTGKLVKTVKYGNDLGTDAEVRGIEAVYAHTGAPVIDEDAVSVVKKAGGAALEAGDYAISIWKDGSQVALSDVRDTGTYAYKVTATGAVGSGWFGELSGTFSIADADRLITDASIVGGIEDSYLFDGKAIAPAPVVKVGDETLIAGYDYEVTYLDAAGNEVEGAQKTGTYTVVVAPAEGSYYVGSARKSFTLETVYMTVNFKKGSSTQAKLKLTKAQFLALEKAGGAPVSALYGRNDWSVATAATYVTLDDLLAKAGLKSSWKSGAIATFADAGGYSWSLTYDEAQAQWFYPNTTKYGFDVYEGRKVPVVLATTQASRTIDEGLVASNIEEANVEVATGALKVPRLIAGVSAASYKAGEYTPGARLVSGVSTVTVTAAPDRTALDRKVTAANSKKAGVKTSAKKGADVTYPNKWVTSAAMTALTKAISNAKAAKTQAEVDAALKALTTAYDNFKPVVGTKAAAQKLTATVKAKTVSLAKVKKANQKVTGAIAVKGAKTALSYSITKVSVAKQKGKFAIDSKGVITVKKNCPKGTYSLTVKATAKAVAKKYASASVTKVVKVTVK